VVATLVGTVEAGFNDGSETIDFGSAPTAGDWDVLYVNSNTTVNTPSGFAAGAQAVANQGAYIFVRQAVGGESTTVDLTTNGSHNTQVIWERWRGLGNRDTGIDDDEQANAAVGGSTPAYNSGTLAGSSTLFLAFGALHSIQSANQSSPVWSSGFTGNADNVHGSGAEAVRGYTGYSVVSGTTAQTPSVSWSGDGAFNRYLLAVAFAINPGATVEFDGNRALTASVTGTAAAERPATGSLGLTTTITGEADSAKVATGNLDVAASITGTAQVVRSNSVGTVRSGWWGYLDIVEEAAQEAEAERSSPPVACPNDGEPLRSAPDGSLYCPYDGWPNEGP